VRIQKEKETEKQRVFINDVKIYPKIKMDFKNGKLKKIPEFFKEKYSILKIMEKKNKLYDDDAYDVYLKLKKTQQYKNEDNIIISENIAGIFNNKNTHNKIIEIKKENIDTQKIQLTKDCEDCDNYKDYDELGNVDDIKF